MPNWTVDDADENRVRIFDEREREVCVATRDEDRNGDPRWTRPEMDANAALIAAAPDLAEALKSCLAQVGCSCVESHPTGQCRNCAQAVAEALAALAKAGIR